MLGPRDGRNDDKWGGATKPLSRTAKAALPAPRGKKGSRQLGLSSVSGTPNVLGSAGPFCGERFFRRLVCLCVVLRAACIPRVRVQTGLRLLARTAFCQATGPQECRLGTSALAATSSRAAELARSLPFAFDTEEGETEARIRGPPNSWQGRGDASILPSPVGTTGRLNYI